MLFYININIIYVVIDLFENQIIQIGFIHQMMLSSKRFFPMFFMQGGIYTLPSHLSPNARDLIPGMLVVDPMRRMTIPEIRQHPWFQARLPRYLAVPPPDTMQQAKKVYFYIFMCYPYLPSIFRSSVNYLWFLRNVVEKY